MIIDCTKYFAQENRDSKVIIITSDNVLGMRARRSGLDVDTADGFLSSQIKNTDNNTPNPKAKSNLNPNLNVQAPPPSPSNNKIWTRSSMNPDDDKKQREDATMTLDLAKNPEKWHFLKKVLAIIDNVSRETRTVIKLRSRRTGRSTASFQVIISGEAATIAYDNLTEILNEQHRLMMEFKFKSAEGPLAEFRAIGAEGES
eukprot:TRINITY_DN4270_c0_g1_i1.p1 TRINITY_DN4270_c0_g1~~TRINITY_DN4270_c0_g1_i1.p1  ORF type:complete len:201 (-),score=38.61 TRINITY_DN4270_c0_g1_i1:18-620(-)